MNIFQIHVFMFIYVHVPFTHMSAFCGTFSPVNVLHVASYLYVITTVEVGMDGDKKKIDAGVKNKSKDIGGLGLIPPGPWKMFWL